MYKRFDTQSTSIERGPLQSTAQIKHLPITTKQQLCTPNYDITVALRRSAMHFLKLQVTNRDKHTIEALKQIFANNLFKISCKYTQ